VNRLITMRVEPFLIAAALGGVMAQRLVRRICEKCIQEHVPTEAEKMALRLDDKAGPFYEGAGCIACFNTGYIGRVAVHEWLPMSRPLKDLIVKGATVDELRDQAIKEGMQTLRDDALIKALEGKTSLMEILRVIQDQSV